MTKSRTANDQRVPDAGGVEAGPQGGPGGTSKAAAQSGGSSRTPEAQTNARETRREHSSDTAQPGYRARPAGQSGVALQNDDTSALGGPQGEGNYLASDRGDLPLRNG